MAPLPSANYAPNQNDPPRKRLERLLSNWTNTPTILDLPIPREDLFPSDSETSPHLTNTFLISDPAKAAIFQRYAFNNILDIHLIRLTVSTSLDTHANEDTEWYVTTFAEVENAEGRVLDRK